MARIGEDGGEEFAELDPLDAAGADGWPRLQPARFDQIYNPERRSLDLSVSTGPTYTASARNRRTSLRQRSPTPPLCRRRATSSCATSTCRALKNSPNGSSSSCLLTSRKPRRRRPDPAADPSRHAANRQANQMLDQRRRRCAGNEGSNWIRKVDRLRRTKRSYRWLTSACKTRIARVATTETTRDQRKSSCTAGEQQASADAAKRRLKTDGAAIGSRHGVDQWVRDSTFRVCGFYSRSRALARPPLTIPTKDAQGNTVNRTPVLLQPGRRTCAGVMTARRRPQRSGCCCRRQPRSRSTTTAT